MLQQWLALASLMGTVLAVALIVALHAIQPGLDPVGRTISEYVLGRGGRLMVVVFFGVALGALALTAAMVTGERPTPGPAGLLGMAAFGLATIVTALFPTDPVDPAAGELRLSRTGVIHATAGMFAFTSLSIAAPLLTGWLAAQTPPLAGPLWVLAVAVPLGYVVFLATALLRGAMTALFGRLSVHGAGERVMATAFLAWLLFAAVAVLAKGR